MSAHSLVNVLTTMRLAGCTHEQRREMANALATLSSQGFAYTPLSHDADARRVCLRAVTKNGDTFPVEIHYNPTHLEVIRHG